MLFGGMGVIGSLLEIGRAGDTIDLFSADETSYSFWFYVDPILGIASAALFAYAGFPTLELQEEGSMDGIGRCGYQHSKRRTWFNNYRNDHGGGRRGGGPRWVRGPNHLRWIILTAIGAVCCGLIVLLPLFMNGNDLDDE